MDKIGTLNHTSWTCNYHIVFIPKCRRRVLFDSSANTWGVFFMSSHDRRTARFLKVM